MTQNPTQPTLQDLDEATLDLVAGAGVAMPDARPQQEQNDKAAPKA